MIDIKFKASEMQVFIENGEVLLQAMNLAPCGRVKELVSVILPLGHKDKFNQIRNLDQIDYDSLFNPQAK
mgnify:CR=1 FL=1